MKSTYFAISIIFLFFVLFASSIKPTTAQSETHPVNIVATPIVFDPMPLKIRLVVMRHSPDGIADLDAGLAIEATEEAVKEGLDLKTIGNHYIAKMNLEELKEFAKEQMKYEATPGDTLILHTIGHGFTSGKLQNIGRRADIMRVFAEAAAETQQETLWWQLSCHACADLPDISTLTEEQRRYFSMLASSTASQTSGTRTQARIMKGVFNAIAKEDSAIDPDNDNIITAEELKNFINTLDGAKRGELIFAQTWGETIFGCLTYILRKFPVLDAENPRLAFKEDYIPLP